MISETGETININKLKRRELVTPTYRTRVNEGCVEKYLSSRLSRKGDASLTLNYVAPPQSLQDIRN